MLKVPLPLQSLLLRAIKLIFRLSPVAHNQLCSVCLRGSFLSPFPLSARQRLTPWRLHARHSLHDTPHASAPRRGWSPRRWHSLPAPVRRHRPHSFPCRPQDPPFFWHHSPKFTQIPPLHPTCCFMGGCWLIEPIIKVLWIKRRLLASWFESRKHQSPL